MQLTMGGEAVDVKLFYETKIVQTPRGKMSGGYSSRKVFTGRTVAVIWDGNTRHIGVSQCRVGDPTKPVKRQKVSITIDGVCHNMTFKTGSPSAHFDKKLGRQIAINRALYAQRLFMQGNRSNKRHVRPGYGKHYASLDITRPGIQGQEVLRGVPEEVYKEIRRDGKAVTANAGGANRVQG